MFSKFKKTHVKILKNIKYYWKLSKWSLLSISTIILIFIKKYFRKYKWLFFIFFGFVIGLLINTYSGKNFTADLLSNYLITAGAMTGGIIAIIFTLSQFLFQGAADLYSSQFFEIYVHDWKEKSIYFIVILITLTFFGGALYIAGLDDIPDPTISLIVISSLTLMGVIFSLIESQYQNVRAKINPLVAISFLEREAVLFLSRVDRDANMIADIIKAKNDDISKEMALATTYNKFLMPHIQRLDRQLENLMEISMKLSDRQEVGATQRGLMSFRNILIHFLDLRKTSSIALPSGTFFLAIESDSQSFLSRNFERLNKAGEKFIKENKIENASFVVDIYDSLAIKARDVNFIGRTNENPILENIIGYLNSYIDYGIRSKDVEVVFQGTRVLANIGKISAIDGLQSTLIGIQNKILEIAIFGLTEKQLVIVDRCNSAYMQIIGSTFVSNKIIRTFVFSDSLKHAATITQYLTNFIRSGYISDDFTSRISLSKFYDELYELTVRIVNNGLEIVEEQKRKPYVTDIAKFFEEINLSLRTLSEKIKICDSTLIDSIGRLIFNINNIMIELIKKDITSAEKTNLKKHLNWFIHLPSWFVYHADKFDGSSNAFRTLTDSVAKTGIAISQNKNFVDKKLIMDCINSLDSIANHVLNKTKNTYGSDEIIVLEKICYLGILALKNNWDEIFIGAALKIYDFELKYFNKYLTNLPNGIDPENHNVLGLPHKDELFRMLLLWRYDFDTRKLNGTIRIMDDAESIMYYLIEKIDIDRFMFAVWQKFPLGSGIEKDIEIKKLIVVLKKIKDNKTKK